MSAWSFTGMDKVGDIWYNINTKAKTAEVTKKSTSGQYSGDFVIPSTIEYEGVECVVNSIAKDAFFFCEKLTSVSIPNSVTSIGACAFQQCTSLKSITIPEKVETIEKYTFAGCSNLDEVNLSSVTTINLSAFSSCKSLTSILFPKTIKTINQKAFYDCSKLDSVIIMDIAAWCKIEFGGGALRSASVFNKAFKLIIGQKEINYLKIPENVTSIPAYAFHNCTSIVSVSFPSTLKEIGERSFQKCVGLIEIEIPENVTTLAANSFSECANLKKVTLSSTLLEIGSSTFSLCEELSDVYCFATECPKASTNAFASSMVEFATLHVPASSINLYKSTKPWSDFGNIVALTEDDETGIIAATEEPTEQKQYFTLDGKRISNPQKGVNIVRMPNGRTKKMINK